MKQGIYQLFSKALDKQLPWGTLTGIRPTKIALMDMKRVRAVKRSFTDFKKDYLASEEKARLCTETVQKEKRSTAKGISIQRRIQSIYRIHFCPSTCLYCSLHRIRSINLRILYKTILKLIEELILWRRLMRTKNFRRWLLAVEHQHL